MKRITTTIGGIAIFALFVLSGCASSARMDPVEKLALFEAAAGEPVQSFRYFGRISGWTPIDDRNLAVWTRPREAWLLTIAGSCRDLMWVPAISLTNRTNRVHAGFDSVRVHRSGPAGTSLPCRISTIRPLDTAKIRDAEKAVSESDQLDEGAEGE